MFKSCVSFAIQKKVLWLSMDYNHSLILPLNFWLQSFWYSSEIPKFFILERLVKVCPWKSFSAYDIRTWDAYQRYDLLYGVLRGFQVNHIISYSIGIEMDLWTLRTGFNLERFSGWWYIIGHFDGTHKTFERSNILCAHTFAYFSVDSFHDTFKGKSYSFNCCQK